MLNLLVISDDFALLASDHTFVVSEFLTHYAKPGNIHCYVACRSHFVDTASVEHLYSLLSVLGYKELVPCYSCQATAITKMVDKASILDKGSIGKMVERMSLLDTSQSPNVDVLCGAISANTMSTASSTNTVVNTSSRRMSKSNSGDNFTLIDIGATTSCDVSRSDSQETLVAYSSGTAVNAGDSRSTDYVTLKSEPDMFSSMTAPLLSQGALIEMSTLQHTSDIDYSSSDESFDHCYCD